MILDVKLKRLVPLALVLMTAGCASEYPEFPDVYNEKVEISSPQLSSIKNYLKINHGLTRSDSYEIRPYIENGDTLMYVVNYAEGWEIFSNSFNLPMKIMGSESGCFDDMLLSSNDGFQCLYENILDVLRKDKISGDTVAMEGSEQWLPYAPTSLKAPIGPPVGEDAVYTLVGEKFYPQEKIFIDHMLVTKWFQEYPFNRFMPYRTDNPKEHIVTGCTACATAQFLYFCHYNFNTQMAIPSSASYVSSSNVYTFTSPSTTLWSLMGVDYYSCILDDVAPKFIGWIAKEINAVPDYNKDGVHTGTHAGFDVASEFINKNTNINTKVINYDCKKVIPLLLEKCPVMIWLVDKSTGEGGHVAVIDAIDYKCDKTDYYYAYVKPSSGNDPDPNPQPGPDTEEGSDYAALVAKYGKIYTETYVSSVSLIKFNWGDAGINSKVEVDSNFLNVKIALNENKDSAEYKPYKIIDYYLN